MDFSDAPGASQIRSSPASRNEPPLRHRVHSVVARVSSAADRLGHVDLVVQIENFPPQADSGGVDDVVIIVTLDARSDR